MPSCITQCSPDTNLQKAAQLMKDSGSPALIVMKAGKIVGTVTQGDVIHQAIATGLDARKTAVERVMSPRVTTVPVDFQLKDIVGKYGLGDFERVIIVNEKNQPVGLLTPQEVFSLFAHQLSVLAAPEAVTAESEVRELAA